PIPLPLSLATPTTTDICTLSLHDALPISYSGLGMTRPAVDAAAGAIISWGDNQQQRQYELAQLESVLARARDLDNYANTLNEERSEEHTSELQSRGHLVCRLLLEKKNKKK